MNQNTRLFIEARRSKDEHSWARFTQAVRPKLETHFNNFLSPRDSEDLVQESLIKAFKAAHTFNPKYSVDPWLKLIAYQLLSRKPGLDNRALSLESLVSSGWDSEAPQTQGVMLTAGYENLSTEQKTILFLKGAGGLSDSDIARHMGKKHNFVTNQLEKAKKLLREAQAPDSMTPWRPVRAGAPKTPPAESRVNASTEKLLQENAERLRRATSGIFSNRDSLTPAQRKAVERFHDQNTTLSRNGLYHYARAICRVLLKQEGQEITAAHWATLNRYAPHILTPKSYELVRNALSGNSTRALPDSVKSELLAAGFPTRMAQAIVRHRAATDAEKIVRDWDSHEKIILEHYLKQGKEAGEVAKMIGASIPDFRMWLRFLLQNAAEGEAGF